MNAHDVSAAPSAALEGGTPARRRQRSVLAEAPASSRAATHRWDERRQSRIEPIDAARGCAMLLVCASHIKQYLDQSAPTLYWLLTSTTRIAMPTFLLLSGFVIGHLLRSDVRGNTRIWLVDRALFLLVAAHLLIGLADLPDMSLGHWLFARTEMTDVIGVALLIAALLPRAPPAVLATLGASACIVSWIVAMNVTFEAGWARVLGALLFYVHSTDGLSADVPMVAYLGVFLIGMALSSYMRSSLLARDDRVITRRLLLIGGSSVIAALMGITAWHFGKSYVPDFLLEPHTMEVLRATLDPRNKWPPSPAYLLFYGGFGLLMAALLFSGRPAWLTRPTIAITSVIGRASLMCFVVQDWLFFLLPRALGFNRITAVPFWFAYLAAGLLLLYWFAVQWDKANGNRFLTVGLKRTKGPGTWRLV